MATIVIYCLKIYIKNDAYRLGLQQPTFEMEVCVWQMALQEKWC